MLISFGECLGSGHRADPRPKIWGVARGKASTQCVGGSVKTADIAIPTTSSTSLLSPAFSRARTRQGRRLTASTWTLLLRNICKREVADNVCSSTLTRAAMFVRLVARFREREIRSEFARHRFHAIAIAREKRLASDNSPK